MKDKMKVAVMTGIKKLEITYRGIPKPKDDEVLIKLSYVGVCGSDLHYYENGRIGNYIVETPFVLGHEAAGTIVGVGKDVKSLNVGDKVALEPGDTCGHCEFCKAGKYNLCNDVVFFATPPVNGTFQEYVTHKESLCFKLPENVSELEGAMIEPLSVGFHAAIQGEARIGQCALIMGAGCIGLMSMLALKSMGISKIIMVDIMQNRLNKALELGATNVINVSESDVIEEVMRITNDKGCDLVIETAGTEVTTRQAIIASRKGANIVLVGYSSNDEMKLPINLAIDKEVTIKTVFRYRNIYPIAINAVASKIIDLKSVVTNIFPLDDIQNAMDYNLENRNDVVKTVIKIGI